MRGYHRVNKNNSLDKVKPTVSHNSLIEGIYIKKETTMNNNKQLKPQIPYELQEEFEAQTQDIVVVEVIAELHIKVTENEYELFDEPWEGEKKGMFVEKIISKHCGFKPNERIDQINLYISEEGV